MTTTAPAPAFPFSVGQEVNWTSEIPGLGIEITTVAVVVAVVPGDEFLDAYAWLLVWGDDSLTISYSDAIPADPQAIAMEKLSPTGRTFTADKLIEIKKRAGIY